MHTSNNVDIADMYAEEISKTKNGLFYEYDLKKFPVGKRKIAISYLEGTRCKTKNFDTYFTNKGPIMAVRDGKWISLRSKNRNAKSLIQSWVRTKSKSFLAYQKAMDLKANASNNTVYADASGNIAYWHGNFIPIRNIKYNWSAVVDGTTSETAWKGLHEVKDMVHVYNPPNGWLQNCNSTPFTAAGRNSPLKANYPSYMAPDGENFRGLAAVKLLSRSQKYALDDVIATGYDPYMPAFEVLIPALVNAYSKMANSNPLAAELRAPIEILKNWDYRSGEKSVATTLAMEWAPRVNAIIRRVYINAGQKDQVESTKEFVKTAAPDELLIPLKGTLTDLNLRFGRWDIAWGDVNRFQRLTGQIKETYNDQAPSIPVGFGSAIWGQLNSFVSTTYNTNKRYGYSGNSFVCVVEFGKRIKAKSILAGGNSGDKNSKHFDDQALMYSNGQFKEVLFYKEDVLKNVERIYRPGE